MRTFRPRARARHSFRSSLLAGLTVVAGASAFAAPAQALTTTHTCALPFVEEQPVTLTATPRTDPAYVVNGFALELDASVQWGAGVLEAVGGNTLELATTLTVAGRSVSSNLQPLPAAGPLVVQPPFRFTGFPANDYTPATDVYLDDLGFTMIVRDANGAPIVFDPADLPAGQIDGDPSTIQIGCTFRPSEQNKRLITVKGNIATPQPTPTPTPTPQPTPSQNVPPLGASEVTATSAVVCWDVTGTLREPVLVLFVRDLGRYEGLETTRRDTYVLPDLRSRICFTLKTLPGTTYDPFLAFELSSGQYATQPVTSTNTRFTTPAIITTPTPTVLPTPTLHVDPTPYVEPTPTVVPDPTPSPTPTPLPSPGPPLFATYDVAGTATLKTLTRGSLPLSGRLGTILEPVGGSIVTSLSLNPSSGNLTALGFLPVAAKVEFVSAGSTNGTLKNGSLSFNAKVRIKLPSVKTLGIELAGGANCQTKQISSIAFSSPQPTFTWEKGGPVAGTFAIGDLTGCGFLTNLVSPLTQGSGNLVALSLTR